MPNLENTKWIWADPELYPDIQLTPYNFMDKWKEGQRFALCAFRFKKTFREIPARIVFSVSGDTTFRFSCNGDYIGRGPNAAGGDFECPAPMPYIYYSDYEYIPNRESVEIYAEVKAGSSVMTEYSCGGGGFFLFATAYFKNGRTQSFCTDEKWECRPLPEYISDSMTDRTVAELPWGHAAVSGISRELRPSPLRNITEDAVIPGNFAEFTVEPGEKVTRMFDFEKIYAAYPVVELFGDSLATVTVDAVEIEGSERKAGEIRSSGSYKHRWLRMYSVGSLRITVSNEGNAPVTVKEASIISVNYPSATSIVNEDKSKREGDFRCSDDYLNRLYELCRHTERICRQSLHLDSPLHQEPLACTGDYMIENHIDAFAFGDLSVSRFDLVRTAQILRIKGARMFHTTYSRLWVQMLRDYYAYTGDSSVFAETYEELGLLMERFNTYMGSSGVLENCPNYMFVDWVNTDGYNLHHPPKALGQTVMNAFYYRALTDAAYIAETVGDAAATKRYTRRAASLKQAYNRCFYDVDRKLYFSGTNSADTEMAKPYHWLPENPLKRYYGLHENVLSVLYGLCDSFERQGLMVRALEDETLTPVQPYFMHFVLDAVYSAGLWERYGMKLLRRWQVCLDKTEKGLCEGWGEFSGDVSHAWGGTPAYQLPARLSGIKMLEPGFEKIVLKPALYGLDSAFIRIPTRYGAIEIDMEKDREPIVTVPRGITVVN
ncbi:MAG: hypothetical protein IJY04_05785 [Clostridia bacterium]|nr:hypothetical protein [Clostridia bacterium]